MNKIFLHFHKYYCIAIINIQNMYYFLKWVNRESNEFSFVQMATI